MKKGIFSISMVLAAILAGCSDEIENGTVTNPVQTGDEVLFGSSLSNEVESRTIYGSRDNNGVAVHWIDGDQIAIFCKETSQPANHLVNYEIKPNPEDSASASEVMKVDPNAAGLQWGKEEIHHFYAFYPASSVHGADSDDQQGTITANIPVNQQPAGWREGKIFSTDKNVNGQPTIFALPDMKYAYMYAYNPVNKNDVQAGSGKVNLLFHNLVTVLDITIPGPASGSVVVTDVTVRAVGGKNIILTGDFNCNIRGAGGPDAEASCTATGDLEAVRNVVNIPCYDIDKKEYITLESGKFLNVKAYLIPDDDESHTIKPRTLEIAVNTLNGGEKVRTLKTADIMPHKVNRVLLPKIDTDGDKYWMSALDSMIYVSELSIPGSKFSVLTSENGASRVYQTATIDKQFEDGIRAFIFQTSTIRSWGSYDGFYVVCESKNRTVMKLSEAIAKIASHLEACENAGKKNEFAFVMLTYSAGDTPLLTDNEQYWIEKLRDEVNSIAGEAANRIYTGEVTANTTIDDVKGKIILKANYNSQNMINDFSGTAPIMFTWWKDAYGPKNADGTYYQDLYGGMPMDWGKPIWYLDSPAKLRWYYQEVTSVGSGQEATRAEKETFIKNLFTKSVDLYKNGNAHKTWFMNDLGGYYSENGDINNRGTGIQALAIDMNNLGVQELQKRTENAGLGLIFMNFADKQPESGAKYKSDYLIQTIIMNNRKFQLRKKGSSETRTEYVTRLTPNEFGWDK